MIPTSGQIETAKVKWSRLVNLIADAQWYASVLPHVSPTQMGQTPDCGPHCIDPGPRYPYGYCCSCTMCHGKKR